MVVFIDRKAAAIRSQLHKNSSSNIASQIPITPLADFKMPNKEFAKSSTLHTINPVDLTPNKTGAAQQKTKLGQQEQARASKSKQEQARAREASKQAIYQTTSKGRLVV
ncbi:MAG: hypothetical protein P3M74_00175 [Candidatus Hodgkinia cicadicola]|nr:MAG: hypothetical protein P3M74_00175 [Candidatus Hodgkinia cicadicola]